MHTELSLAATYIQIDPLAPFGLAKVDSSVRAKGISTFFFYRMKEKYKSNTEDHHKPE